MEQIITVVAAIVFGVGGVLAYYFASNLLIDRIFADDPPSFSAPDFIALASAAVLLIAFIFMPWVSDVAASPDMATGQTYTGGNLLSAQSLNEDGEGAIDVAQFGLFLIPAGAIMGLFFALWGLFTPLARGNSAVGTMGGGMVALLYYILFFIRNGQTDIDVSALTEPGFLIAVFAATGLLLQVVIVRPLYTPPTSEIVRKVNTNVRQNIRPWLFVTPALLGLGVFLVYPAVNTLIISFMDDRSKNWTWFDNYSWALNDGAMREAFGNNIMWLVLVPLFSVGSGLLIAILADRVRWESAAKSLIFMPMAISFVGASVVWKFIYAFKPAGESQIGVLNAVVTGFGGEPSGWVTNPPGPPANNLALIVILIWIQTGFAMVLLSAAIKAVPEETLEAARIDGANEVQAFLRIIIPQIMGTIIVVTTTMIIVVLKIFDIVFVMTSGRHGTEVLANRMYTEMFTNLHFGRGSTIAIILMVAVMPVMYYNIRNFQKEEAFR